MKLNEYFSLADIASLSKEQFEALRKYLKFIGIDFDDPYEDIKFLFSNHNDYVLAVYDFGGFASTPYIRLTYDYDEDLTTRHDINDIMRMVEIGEAMTHEY